MTGAPPAGPALGGHLDPARPVTVILTGVAARAHLLYAASYLRALLAATSGPVRVIVGSTGSFLGERRVDPTDFARLLPEDPRLTLIDTPTEPAPEDQWVYLAIGAPGIKPYLRLLQRRPGRRLHVVVTDEGIGSYGTWRTRRAAWLRQGGGKAWTALRALAVAGADRLVSDERWSLYLPPVQAGEPWRLHEPVAEEFRRQVDGVAGPSGRAVFVTQPWVEMGALDAAAYLDHLHQVEAACRTAGLHLQLALHPAEDASKYADFDVIGSGQLAELDREVLSADVLLGTDSTALLNAAAIHRVPALRVRLDPLQHHEQALAPDQAALLDSFLPAPLPVAQLAERLRTP